MAERLPRLVLGTLMLGSLAVGACATPAYEEELEDIEADESAIIEGPDGKPSEFANGKGADPNRGTNNINNTSSSSSSSGGAYQSRNADDVNRTGGQDGATDASLSPVASEPNLFGKLSELAKRRAYTVTFDVQGPMKRIGEGRPVPGATMGHAIPGLNHQMPLNWGRDPSNRAGGNGSFGVTKAPLLTLEPLLGDSVHPMLSMGAEVYAPLHELRVIGTPSHLIAHGFKNTLMFRRRIPNTYPETYTAWMYASSGGQASSGWNCRGDACMLKNFHPSTYTGWVKMQFMDARPAAERRVVTVTYRTSRGRFTSVQFGGSRPF